MFRRKIKFAYANSVSEHKGFRSSRYPGKPIFWASSSRSARLHRRVWQVHCGSSGPKRAPPSLLTARCALSLLRSLYAMPAIAWRCTRQGTFVVQLRSYDGLIAGVLLNCEATSTADMFPTRWGAQRTHALVHPKKPCLCSSVRYGYVLSRAWSNSDRDRTQVCYP